jgi:hypothetical protein
VACRAARGLLIAGKRLHPEAQPRELFGDNPQLKGSAARSAVRPKFQRSSSAALQALLGARSAPGHINFCTSR